MDAALRRAVPARVALMLVGSLLSSYGYLMTVRAEVGNGPMFALQDALRLGTGLSLGFSAVVVGLSFAALARGLGVRLGIGPIVIPVLTGLTVAVLEPVAVHVDGAVLRWGSFSVGTIVMMLGGVLMLRAGVGGSALESAMFGVARVARTTTARARIGLEVSMAAGAFVFGGGIGPGTAVMAVAVGPLFAFWHRFVPHVVTLDEVGPGGSRPRDSTTSPGKRRLTLT